MIIQNAGMFSVSALQLHHNAVHLWHHVHLIEIENFFAVEWLEMFKGDSWLLWVTEFGSSMKR